MTIRYDGQVAIVTGSGNGLGRSHSLALAARGAKVVVNDLGGSVNGEGGSSDAALETVAMIEAGGGEAIANGANVAKMNEVEAMVAQAVEKWGRVDILVNNAGIQHVASIDKFPAKKWDAIIAINLSSAFHTTAIALPMMRKAGWGRVVNIASAHGLTASPYKSAYIAAKHGVVGLTKTTALETAEESITCNAICPGYVLTPLVEKQIPATMEEYGLEREAVIRDVLLSRQPSKEFATMEQIGGTTVFLASDAATQITGTTISVDGGWTAL